MVGVTLKNVAKASGLSVTTVSRVLGGSDYPISPDTRELILATAKQLGYIPNMLARSLKTNISNEIAVVMPSISNPFYTSMITGIESTLSANNYSMILYFTGRNGRRDSDLISSLRGKMIAGVIIASDSVSPALEKDLMRLKENKISVLMADYALDTSQQFTGVYFDYLKGALMAANHLLENGHKKIAFATQALDRRSRQIRVDGFFDACSQAKITVGQEDLFEDKTAEIGFQTGIKLAKEIAESDKKYTAVVAINDMVALGLLAGLSCQNIRVPQDISVIGFDDCIYAQMSIPQLTTIRVPAEEMGMLVAKRMVDELSGQKVNYNIYIEPELTDRGTVCALKAEKI